MYSAAGREFYSKVLLFGEYSLMAGSMALSIPNRNYCGQLKYDLDADKIISKHYSVKYLLDYYQFLLNNDVSCKLNLDNLLEDINNGLIFETNIPISYGLGSSGSIVASIYDAYAKKRTRVLSDLKGIFSEMESYYHGKSSGLDPLVSYINKPILIKENNDISTIELPKIPSKLSYSFFLLDTKQTGETQPLVNWFLNNYKDTEYKRKIQDQFIPLTNSCINNVISGNYDQLFQDMRMLSEFTFNNFSPMIPKTIRSAWQMGLGGNLYSLKLCGSGGGGMMLGFTNDFEKTKNALHKFDLHLM